MSKTELEVKQVSTFNKVFVFVKITELLIEILPQSEFQVQSDSY